MTGGAGYVLLSGLHAEPYFRVLAVALLVVIVFAVEWCVATYRCAHCGLAATRRDLSSGHAERA